jgi:hypothetical protein
MRKDAKLERLFECTLTPGRDEERIPCGGKTEHGVRRGERPFTPEVLYVLQNNLLVRNGCSLPSLHLLSVCPPILLNRILLVRPSR